MNNGICEDCEDEDGFQITENGTKCLCQEGKLPLGPIDKPTSCVTPVSSTQVVQLYPATAESVDWREKGVVSSVKDQKMCGSCWAFSASAMLETSYAIKTGEIVDISEQQQVDCVVDAWGSPNTCEGGNVVWALDHFAYVYGMLYNSQYDYDQKRNLTCREENYPAFDKVDTY